MQIIISWVYLCLWLSPNFTQLMTLSSGQEKKIPMALNAKWKHPGYLTPMCYMSDGAFISIGLLPDAWNCGLRKHRECRERFFHHRLQRKETAGYRSRHALRHVCHARALMHVGIANPQGREKRSRHSRRMHSPQFYVSDKRPIGKR